MYLSQIEKCICLELETVYVLIAEEDFCVIALDTRLSGHGYAILYYITFWSVFVTIIKRLSGHGYAILSREQPKLFKLSETTVLGSTGCWCDILTFCKVCIFSFSTLGQSLKVMKIYGRLLKCVWRLTVTPTGEQWLPLPSLKWLPLCSMARGWKAFSLQKNVVKQNDQVLPLLHLKHPGRPGQGWEGSCLQLRSSRSLREVLILATSENQEWMKMCFRPRCGYRAGGSAVSLLQPLLDNQVC